MHILYLDDSGGVADPSQKKRLSGIGADVCPRLRVFESVTIKRSIAVENNATTAPTRKSKLDVTTAKSQPDTYTAADISEMCDLNGWKWVMAGSRHFAPDRFFVKLWAENYPETCMVDMEGESLPAALHAAKNFVNGTSPREYRTQYPGWGRY